MEQRFEIVAMEPRHRALVANLHLTQLATRLRGLPGEIALRAYYAAVAVGQGACGYVAESDGAVAGFVCGVWDFNGVQVALRNVWPLGPFIWAGMRLRAALGLWRRPRKSSQALRAGRSDAADKGYELRPIVVAASFRGTGVAAALLNALLADAAGRGFDRIWLKTEVHNAAANRFYLKAGFNPRKPGLRSDGGYVYYERLTRPGLAEPNSEA